MKAAAFLLALLPFAAHGEIFACMNAAGVVKYSLTKPTTPCYAPAKGANRGGTVARVGPADFPRVDTSTQRSRDDSRRRILENELADETILHREAESQEKAAHHERNIQAIRRELASIR